MFLPRISLIRTLLMLVFLALGPLGILDVAHRQLGLGLLLCILLVPVGSLAAPKDVRRLFTLMLTAVAIGTALNLFLGNPIGAWAAQDWPRNSQTAGMLLFGVFHYAIGAGVVWLGLWLTAGVGADFLVGLSELVQDKAGTVRGFLIRQFLGINQAFQIVENGAVTVTRPAGVLTALGGKGLIVIKPANAIVTEWGGNIKRALGPGIFWSQQFEQIKHVLDLNQQRLELDVPAQTREGIPLGARVLAYYQIKSAPKAIADPAEKDRIAQDLNKARLAPEDKQARELALKLGLPQPKAQPINAEAILQVIYCATNKGWKQTAEDDIRVAVTEAINHKSLDEVYILGEARNRSAAITTTLSRDAQRRANDRTSRWGVTVTSLTITGLEAPLEIRDLTLKPLSATADATALGTRGQAQADLAQLIESKRSQVRTAEIDRMVRLLEEYQDKIHPDQLLRAVMIAERLTGAIAGQTPEDGLRLIQAAEDAIGRLVKT